MWWKMLMTDTHRIYGRSSWLLFSHGLLTSRTYRVLFTLRLGQSRLGWLAAPLHRWTCGRAGIDFPRHSNVGPGLAINHGWGIVISSGAKIGKNVTLFQGVTIGRRDRLDAQGRRTTEFPIIEDSVCVGPHAIIVGGVTIGRGSRISPGSVIVESIPAQSVAQGNPALIVRENCLPDVMNPIN
jgi:serine O-acetyltransferase